MKIINNMQELLKDDLAAAIGKNSKVSIGIAKECADWVRQKVTFKSNITYENMGGFINVQNDKDRFTYMPVNGFTTADLGCEKGNNIYNMIN